MNIFQSTFSKDIFLNCLIVLDFCSSLSAQNTPLPLSSIGIVLFLQITRKSCHNYVLSVLSNVGHFLYTLLDTPSGPGAETDLIYFFYKLPSFFVTSFTSIIGSGWSNFTSCEQWPKGSLLWRQSVFHVGTPQLLLSTVPNLSSPSRYFVNLNRFLLSSSLVSSSSASVALLSVVSRPDIICQLASVSFSRSFALLNNLFSSRQLFFLSFSCFYLKSILYVLSSGFFFIPNPSFLMFYAMLVCVSIFFSTLHVPCMLTQGSYWHRYRRHSTLLPLLFLAMLSLVSLPWFFFLCGGPG